MNSGGCLNTVLAEVVCFIVHGMIQISKRHSSHYRDADIELVIEDLPAQITARATHEYYNLFTKSGYYHTNYCVSHRISPDESRSGREHLVISKHTHLHAILNEVLDFAGCSVLKTSFNLFGGVTKTSRGHGEVPEVETRASLVPRHGPVGED